MRVTLWAQSISFSGGTLSATSPSRGSYCVIVTREEFGPSACSSSDGYCIVDWYQFGASEQFQ